MWKWFMLLIALPNGYFLYEYLTSKRWDKAIERSYYAVTTIMIVALAQPWK